MEINIGENIKKVRVGLGLTQQEFKELFNKTEPFDIRTSKGDIGRYELNINRCPAEKYVKFLALINYKK